MSAFEMLAFFRFIKFYNEGEITMVSVRKRGKANEKLALITHQTDMWSAYEWSKSSQFNYFKAE